MRHDDTPQILPLRPTSEVPHDFAFVFAQQEFHRRRDMRIVAGESHDFEQPPAEATFTVNVADQIVPGDSGSS